MSLSDEIVGSVLQPTQGDWLNVIHVEKAIKELKESLCNCADEIVNYSEDTCEMCQEINEIFGDKLVRTSEEGE